MQFVRPTIIKSKCHSIPINLSYEAYLFQKCVIQAPILFLWQNDKTIVIGRHQNPWKECNLQAMERDKVQLQRRNSGGGAVYQDLGNYCFTFLNQFVNQDPKTQNNHLLLKTLGEMGIVGETSGRNDILTGGKKISGSAYQLSLGSKLNPCKVALHHGTMLIDVEFEGFRKYLTPNKKKLESKGIESVSQRVINLKELDKSISVERFEKILIKKFEETYKEYDYVEQNESELMKIEEVNLGFTKLSSWDWLYGYTPQFTVNLEERFDWGIIDIYLRVENNIIQETRVFSDSLNCEYISELNRVLLKKKYNFEGIEEAISELNNAEYSQFNEQLKIWLLGAI